MVVGTRAAAFAPVHDLGLVVVWDDGDDLYAEPRAPYPHTRETLLLRAEREGAAALLGGFARSVEADHLLRSGWAHELGVPRERLRDRVTVRVAGASDAELARDPFARGTRMPTLVHDVIGEALAHRTGAGADAPARVRRGAGVRAVPDRRPLLGLPGSARHPAGRRRAALRVVRYRPSRLGVSGVRAPRPARPGRRRRADRRGARPDLPVDTSADVVLGPDRAGGGRSAAGDRGGHARGRAGGRGRVRRRGAARRLADARSSRPAHGRGGRPALGQRDRAGAPRRPRGRGGRPGVPRSPGARAVGPGRVRRARVGRAGRRPPAAGVPAGHDHRRARARRRRAHPAGAARGGRGAGAGAGRRRRRGPGRAAGAAGPRRRAVAGVAGAADRCGRRASWTRCASRSIRCLSRARRSARGRCERRSAPGWQGGGAKL